MWLCFLRHHYVPCSIKFLILFCCVFSFIVQNDHLFLVQTQLRSFIGSLSILTTLLYLVYIIWHPGALLLKIVLSVISHLFGFVLWICIGYFCRCFKQCAWSRFCKFLPGVLGAVSLKTCGFDFLVIESQWAGRLFLVPFLIAMYLHFSYP